MFYTNVITNKLKSFTILNAFLFEQQLCTQQVSDTVTDSLLLHSSWAPSMCVMMKCTCFAAGLDSDWQVMARTVWILMSVQSILMSAVSSASTKTRASQASPMLAPAT